MSPPDSLTILVHGFNKGSRDMRYLARGLFERGFSVLSVELPTTFGSLDQAVRALARQIDPAVARHRRIHFVAHSLGGLITRAYLAQRKAQNTGHCVFIATPHGGSPLAALAHRIPLYSAVFRPIHPLRPGADVAPLPAPRNYRVGLIAGNRNTGLLGRLFLSPSSDGRVEVRDVAARDADEFLILPYGHKDIHHRQATLDAVEHFLNTGHFPARDPV
ncbi:MAG: alpha/beta fold hydrolase [Pseudomonadota bacterium]